MSRVTSSSSSGTVNIQDSNGNTITSVGGALEVVLASGGTTVNVYNEVTGIAMNATATVVTYTVPMSTTFQLNKILCSSDSISTLEVQFSSIPNAKARLYYTGFNYNFDFSGLILSASTVITLVATNNSLQGAASFNATLQGTVQ